MIHENIHVLLVDDHPGSRELVRIVLSADHSIKLVGEVEDGLTSVRFVEMLQPDVVVMDIVMPGVNGLEATRRIRDRFPEVKIVILSVHPEEAYVVEAMRAGASAYVLKTTTASDLLTAVRTAAMGDTYFSPLTASGVDWSEPDPAPARERAGQIVDVQ